MPTITPSPVSVAPADRSPAPVGRPSLSMSTIVDLVGARSLWRRGITGSGVAVAVVDTGVADVPELANVIARVDLSADHVDPEVAHADRHGHGTHLAGIIAGRSAGADPVDPVDPVDDDFIGVAPDAGIVAVKVAGSNGEVDATSLLTGLEWVIAHAADLGIRVVNLAFSAAGADPVVAQALHAAVERAWEAGLVVVTAAGNGGADGDGLVTPATNPYVLSVGSLTVAGGRISASAFTSRGDDRRRPDLAAPGAHVESLRAPGSAADLEHPEGYVDEQRFLASGSSQAAAVVAGVAALVIQDRPDATADQVKQLLIDAAAPVEGDRDTIGAGMVSGPAACARPLPDASQTWHRTAPVAVPRAAGAATIAITPTGTTWMGNTWTGTTWMGTTWMGNTWTGTTWMGNTWTGTTWMGNTWTGTTWMGNTWTGTTWMGNTWTGTTWMGNTWTGTTWMGNTWTGTTWMGNTWTGTTWMGNTWT